MKTAFAAGLRPPILQVDALLRLGQRTMSENPTVETMLEILHQQRQAQIKGGAVSAALRIDRLRRAVNVLEQNGDAFCDAMSDDWRRSLAAKLTDIQGAITPLKDAIKNVPTWMKPEKEGQAFLGLLGGRCRIEFQPRCRRLH